MTVTETAIIGALLGAIATLTLSGLPALLSARRSTRGQQMAATLMAVGSALGLCAIGLAMRMASPASLDVAWLLPVGRFSVSVDAISALFLAPVFAVPALGSIYGLAYWKQRDHPGNGRKLSFSYGMLAGSMALVVIARDAVLFLIAWEIMALAAFFAATTEDDDAAVRSAGWVYLVATHLGTLCLLAMFALLHHATGTFGLQPLDADVAGSSVRTGIFLLALVGFGLKAGIMPLHVWLPGAHANAPSHVSAVMSGVMLKMGVYGIVRIAALLPLPPTWWGGLLLAVGAATGVLGIAFAIGQQDLKRLLAYSSIENIGIIAMGLGLALLGRSLERVDWIALGLGGALLHVWNHSLFKSLLFFDAGAIIHATHTRQIDQLGGLARQMPRTAGLFVFGAIAICALPPLNGFVSEWLIYQGLLRTIGADSGAAWPAAAAGIAVLGLIGALAVACFVKVLGAVFLGVPRSDAAAAAHDPGASLVAPMAALAIGCAALTLFPWLAAPILDRAVAEWAGAPQRPMPLIRTLAPLFWLSVTGSALIAASLAAMFLVRRAIRRHRLSRAGTWDCGYIRPTARMQYTGSSFGHTLVRLFAWALWPQRDAPRITALFPAPTALANALPDPVLDRVVLPLFRAADGWLPWLRLFQQGQTQVYILYFLIIILLLLLWGSIGL